MLKRVWAAIKAGVKGMIGAVVDAGMTLFGMKIAGVLAPAAGAILGVSLANELAPYSDSLVAGVAVVVCGFGGLALGVAVAPLLVGVAEFSSLAVLGWRTIWTLVEMVNVGLGDAPVPASVRETVASRAQAYVADFTGMLEADGVATPLAKAMAKGTVDAVLLACEATNATEERTISALDDLMAEYLANRAKRASVPATAEAVVKFLARVWSAAKALARGVINAFREIVGGVAGLVIAPVMIPLSLYRAFRDSGYALPSALLLATTAGAVMTLISWVVTLVGIPVGMTYALCEGAHNAGVALLGVPPAGEELRHRATSVLERADAATA